MNRSRYSVLNIIRLLLAHSHYFFGDTRKDHYPDEEEVLLCLTGSKDNILNYIRKHVPERFLMMVGYYD